MNSIITLCLIHIWLNCYLTLAYLTPLVLFLSYRPGFSSFLTGYLPSAILNGFVYIVPFAIIEMARLAGYISKSRKDIKACNMVFYFLVGNVFFLSLLSGSLLDQIGEYFSNPKDFPSRLATAATAQVRSILSTHDDF